MTDLPIPAVIIAAGRGSRLESLHNNRPKTLLAFDEDRRIIDIILSTLHVAGVSEIIMVVGYQSDILRQALGDGKAHGVSITYVQNDFWEKPNGISVLAAAEAVGDRQFLLSMSDHLFESALVKQLIEYPLNSDAAVVAVDTNIGGIHDIDDAMKLRTDTKENRTEITRMEKSLIQYDSVDCGLFKGTPNLFRALDTAIQQGRESLSQGCEILMTQHKMFGCDITGNFWIDVDTPDALREARKRWTRRMAESE